MLVAAVAGAPEGDWLIADRQTAGRGRIGRAWESPNGNLYASGLVRLRPTDPDAATLALVAAIALYDTIVIWAPMIQLKWPNDVLAHGAKLSGILLERASNAIVIGFGVNLAHHPENLDRPATSLVALGSALLEPSVVLEVLSQRLKGWVDCWRREGVAKIRTSWIERAHAVGTALVANLPNGEAIDGLFDGLTKDCALRLRLADGTVRVIHAGDVFLI